MKILIGATGSNLKSQPGPNLKSLGQKYLCRSVKLTKDYLLQASAGAFDIFIISANHLSFYAAKKNVELFRKKFFEPPLLVIDANYNSSQRANLLELGADDCMMTQADTKELMAKVEIFGRRPIRQHPDLIKYHNFTFNIQSRVLSFMDEDEQKLIIPLGFNEILLIELFLENKKRIISKDQILDKITDNYSTNPMNLVEVNIYNLRKKIRIATGLEIIETVRKLGYRL